AGTVPGENAVDTKTRTTGTSYITIRRCVASGFRGAIANQAAFNIKELVNCTMDGIVVTGSEIAFRLRTPAKATVKNCVSYSNDYAIRYESANTTLLHNTFGPSPQIALFQGDSSPLPPTTNCLYINAAGTVPTNNGNLSAGTSAVVNAAGGDFRPASGSVAIDKVAVLATCNTDLPGNPRPNGPLADVGAYEYGSSLYTVVAGPGTAPGNLAPIITTAAYATPNPVVNANSTVVRVVASDPDSSPAALTYTWSKLSGPGTVSFSPNGSGAAATSTATFSATGTYSLQVSVFDGAASTTSTIASLSVTLPVTGTAPAITAQPTAKTVTAGQTATFTVTATGSPAVSYQWQKNSVNIAGATSSSYTTPATLIADNGSLFRVIVTNTLGSVTSNTALLTVNAASNPVTASVANVTLTAPPGSTTPVSTSFTITNTSGSAVTVTTADGQAWLTISPVGTFTINPGQTVTVTVTGDPSGMSGVLSGSLTLTTNPGAQVRTIPVSFDLSGTTSTTSSDKGKRSGCSMSTAPANAGLLLPFLLLFAFFGGVRLARASR
ncbi:MAG TPA: immunoglobulin domain-containing protein, partial [Planctomycetota bacterium]|nr:immunoglobulin domain-containing protein [Planctomycetota bacterium]